MYANSRTEEYLERLSHALGAISAGERAEILSDIRSLVTQRLAEQGSALDEVLARLGKPETLAAAYRTEGLLSIAARRWTPLPLLRAVGRWATLGIEGFFAFVALLIGYTVALGFTASALAKPFWPAKIGLWHDGPFFTIGLQDPHWTSAHELLGFWLIPVGLGVGAASFALTTIFVRYLIHRHLKGRLKSDVWTLAQTTPL